MSKIELDTLPESIRLQIEELNRPQAPLFPLAPREHTNVHMQTKEIVEIAYKVDQLIEAVNTLHENLSNRK